jgi:hypothetical protein
MPTAIICDLPVFLEKTVKKKTQGNKIGVFILEPTEQLHDAAGCGT